MRKLFERILLPADTTVLETLRAIDETALEIALIVDENRRLLGTVTDGDIRRGILRGVLLSSPVEPLMNKNPITADTTVPDDELLFMMSRRSIKHMPIVDGHKRVVNLRRLQDLVAREPRENWAVIMAGGLGKRLGTLTQTTPKPLLPVGNRPILETIVRQLRRHGIIRVFISVNYKSDQIKRHFQNLSDLDLKVEFLEEKEFLGTAGSLSLLPEKPIAPIVVMNGDILSPVNFSNLLDYHEASGRDMTICTREFSFQIPYGVILLQGADLINIEEKPEQKFLINAGIYILNPSALELLSGLSNLSGKARIDMPDLIRKAALNKGGVACYPLSELWLDIGNPPDYRMAQSRFPQIFSPDEEEQ